MACPTTPQQDYDVLQSPGKQTTAAPGHPLTGAGVFATTTFGWVSPLVKLGNGRQLTPDDIWPLQDSNKVTPLLTKYFAAYMAKDRSLLRAFFSVYGRKLMWIGAMNLFVAGSELYGPAVVLPAIIQTVQATEDGAHPLDWTRAILWVLSLLGVQLVSALLQAHVTFLNNIMGVQFAACLRSMIFQKALRLNAASRKVATVGEIANLFSVDVAQVLSFALNINNVWLIPVQMFLTLYLIERQVGWAIYIGLAVLVFILLVSMVAGTHVGAAQVRVLGAKDDRMQALHELFGAIQIVKFNAWEESMVAKVLQLRAVELAAIVSFVQNYLVLITSMYTTPVAITVSVFATYSVWMGRLLSVSIVFTTLALFKTLQVSFIALPGTFVVLVQAFVSIQRMGAMLDLPDLDNVVEATTPKPVNPKKDPTDDTIAVAITDGTFGWDTTPLFTNLSWRVRRGELVVVHGAVGAGKSSLASILLGEMPKTAGSVMVTGRVAYFAQQSWIQNATIRDNILFAKPYDAIKYRKVLAACALTNDLAALPAGDRTEIGLKGVNLSGGQQARVSLARACYSDADIFILDAPLAALDAIVAHHVFHHCFLDLLRHKTVILFTHNPDVIDSPAIDRSFLVQDGRLVETTTDEPRVQPDHDTALVSPLAGDHRQAWDEGDDIDVPRPARIHDLFLSPSVATSNRGYEIWTPRYSSSSALHGEPLRAALIVDEGRAEGRVSKDVVMGYLGAIGGWWALAAMVGATAVTEGIRVGSDLWLSHWTNQASTKSEAAFRASTNYNLTVYSLLVLALCIVTVVQLSAVFVFGLKGSKALFRRMLDGVVQAPMRFFDTNPIGRILNRFGDDIFQCDLQLPLAFAPILAETAAALNKLVTSVVIVQFMGLVIPPLLYAYAKLGAYYLGPFRELNRIQKTTLSPLLSLVSQSVDGAVTIRSFGAPYTRRFVRLHDHAIEAYAASRFASVAVSTWFSLRVQLLSNAIVFAILLGCVLMHSRLSAAVIGLAISYGLGIPANLANLVNMWAQLETALIAPERIHEYASVEPEGDRETPVDANLGQTWPAAGAIEFARVSFRYKPDDPLVLTDVSFAIGGGEKVGVVGRTGAGKSSLMMTLFRINEVAGGAIRIDGVDIATVGLKKLRSSLAIIPQNPVLFKGTLRHYLDPFETCTDERLWAVLGKVNMLTRVAGDDAKLEQLVEENGDNYSVGERQMFCLARALLQQAKIVVLDEATSAMDHNTDQLLQHVIRQEFTAATVLTIAHRLDTVLDYNRIMVFDHGHLVQCDTPEALIARGSGIFFEMITDGGYLHHE
ncbi:Aste57867_1523 [Aphanomyces stellatus]|uniref:Aste57867_1523 protein n=1 Tax=Aphanomyces stellatus TaxID=120398 RepID=A0A485K5H3_9STRA|nr:hypothetical protein As57867_001522 [Aphanomyces stellatus]VFT78739.1 Aste57867_1523 [Aphanomyces stellatus]